MTPTTTAIITGAASGIGKHWAGALNRTGEYQLVLADMNEDGLRAAFTPSESLRLHVLDIRSAEQWQRVIDDTLERFGRIDYLFNIAGGGRQAFFLEQPIENIDWTIDVNLKGPLIGMKLVGQRVKVEPIDPQKPAFVNILENYGSTGRYSLDRLLSTIF